MWFQRFAIHGHGDPCCHVAGGCQPEIITDGVNGFLAGDDNEWIKKLSLLIESESLRKTIGAAGRKTVQERYSVESLKYKYLEYFNEVLGL